MSDVVVLLKNTIFIDIYMLLDFVYVLDNKKGIQLFF